jgi:hypothetical protein
VTRIQNQSPRWRNAWVVAGGSILASAARVGLSLNGGELAGRSLLSLRVIVEFVLFALGLGVATWLVTGLRPPGGRR